MSSNTVIFMASVFGASLVECVEALTIVLAAATRHRRSALEGALAALAVLALAVTLVGLPLVHWVPIAALRAAVGALLLVLGLSWLRKAILRSSGHKALHDEDAIFAETAAELSHVETGAPDARTFVRDPLAFAVAFKGTFLEGTEVALIVFSLGSTQHRLGWAALAALAAVLLVALLGLLIARQLSEVPENTIKTIVGVMLTSFGSFWLGEGLGVNWPGGDWAIPMLVGFFVLVTAAGIALLRVLAPAPPPSTAEAHAETPSSTPSAPPERPAVLRALRAFGGFWWDFLVGDSPAIFVAVLATVGLLALARHLHTLAEVGLLVIVVATLWATAWTGRRRPAAPVSAPR